MRNANILDFMIVFFGVVNLFRVALLLVGSDIYSLQKHLSRKKSKIKIHKPTISVIIPAFNEEKTVLRSIHSVVNNHYPQDKLEIIIIDDGSSDDTFRKVQAYQRQHNIRNLKIVSQTNSGKAHALNNAIKNHASGDLVMCLDADSLIAPNALNNSIEYFQDPTVQALSANVKILPEKSFLNFIQRYEYLVCYQMKRAHNAFNIEYIIGGIGSMFRKSIIKQVGYYDTDTVTEDIDLTMKIIRQGNKSNKVLYGSDVIAYTESCLSIGALIRQRFRWKWGRMQTFYKNPRMFFNSQSRYTKMLTFLQLPFAVFGDFAFFFEPILVTYIFFITIFYRDWRTLLSAWIVVSSYLALNVLAEETISIRQRLKLSLFAPLMYFTFYLLSFVEYIALIKSLSRIFTLPSSVKSKVCNWQHVERSGQARIAV